MKDTDEKTIERVKDQLSNPDYCLDVDNEDIEALISIIQEQQKEIKSLKKNMVFVDRNGGIPTESEEYTVDDKGVTTEEFYHALAEHFDNESKK